VAQVGLEFAARRSLEVAEDLQELLGDLQRRRVTRIDVARHEPVLGDLHADEVRGEHKIQSYWYAWCCRRRSLVYSSPVPRVMTSYSSACFSPCFRRIRPSLCTCSRTLPV